MSKNKSAKKTTWEKLNSEIGQKTAAQESVTQEEKLSSEQPELSSETLTLSSFEALKKQLTQAEAQLAEHKSTLLYQRAEMANVERRAKEEIKKIREFSLERFIKNLLPVKDNLERALELAENPTNNPTLQGIQLTLQTFQKVLEENGVKSIAPGVGDIFDPHYHQAMSVQETTEQEPDTILFCPQKGYSLQGRLIRPAVVVVAKAPEKKS